MSGDVKKMKKEKEGGSKDANAYQKKRGVEYTDEFVFFGGTVWCSSYYTASILLDGSKFGHSWKSHWEEPSNKTNSKISMDYKKNASKQANQTKNGRR